MWKWTKWVLDTATDLTSTSVAVVCGMLLIMLFLIVHLTGEIEQWKALIVLALWIVASGLLLWISAD